MPINTRARALSQSIGQRGITLIETVVFMVIVSIALSTLLMVFNQSVMQSVDPALRVKALERGQGVMDLILTRKFDENTPTGGVPACGTSSAAACAGIVADTDYDDIGDFNGYSSTDDPRFPLRVSVVEAGTELGLPLAQARRITVTVTMPDGNNLTLAAYKANF